MNNHETGFTSTYYSPAERRRVAELLDTTISPFMGSVFLTALDEYHQFKLLQSVEINFLNDFDRFVGGVNADGKPMVVLGLNHEVVTPRLQSRIIRRFGLPFSAEDAPPNLFKLFVFAHELGHVIQADSKFKELFGEIDDTTYQPEVDYERYVESDHEANADYIAATIIAKSEVGIATKYEAPSQSPIKWREWAAEHKINR